MEVQRKSLLREAYIDAAKHLQLEESTGNLRWKARPDRNAQWNGKHAGKIAGAIISSGYRTVRTTYCGRKFCLMAHSLAWLIYRGDLPSHEIDHLNGDRLDNRPENLRDVSRGVNNHNLRKSKRNTSGYSGVYWNTSAKKWQAYCRVNGKIKYIGVFSDIEEAAEAVRKVRRENGYTERHGS